MKNIIKVYRPLFFINKDNPYEVSYDPDLIEDNKWKLIHVGSVVGSFPTIRNNEICYLYNSNMACTINGIQYRKNKINKLINKLKIKCN